MASNLIQIKVSGLMCSFCTMSVEKALGRLPGVKNVQVNLVHGIVLVEVDHTKISEAEVAEKVEDLGYTVVATEAQQYKTDEAIFSTIKKRGFLAIGLAIADLFFDPLNVFSVSGVNRAVVSGIVAGVVLLWIGYPILRKTLMVIRQRVINANVLLSSGAWGAVGIGIAHLVMPTEYPNFFPIAIWLMALHLFFAYFKLGTRKSAADSVRKLLSLQVQKARVIRGSEEIEVPVEEVVPGETVVIRPGERVPLDGIIQDGSSSFDMSSVTGESQPVYRELEGEVVGGTINLDGFVRIEVTHPASEGFVSQVVKLMRQIEERKPPIQLLMDRLMNYYGPVVYLVAFLATIGWLIYSGDVSQSVLIGLTTIIMGYPCALGITTPMVLAIGSGHGIARGLLVRAGEFFQALSEVNMVVFDKTGTLTYGRPTVSEVISFDADEDDVLATIAAAEAGSEHPIGGAIVRYAEFQDVSVPKATDFRAVPGKGVRANVGGKNVIVGRGSFLGAEGVEMNGHMTAHIAKLEEGHTVVYAASDGKMLGAVALQDIPRPGTAGVMKQLRKLGIRTAMLTGDSRAVAETVGNDIGIDEIHAELLPKEKVSVIEQLQLEGHKVAMVGDGINDAPALVQSDVGIALGAGTDVAIESAGVVLVSDKLEKVVSSINLGRASHRKMKQNIFIAVVMNVVGMTLAILGLITAPIAIGVMTVSVFAVLLSTLSLMRLDLGAAESEDVKGLTETVIPARKIHCEACSRKIIKQLSAVEGVRKVVPDVTRKEVFVAFEPARVNEERLRGELEQLGFR